MKKNFPSDFLSSADLKTLHKLRKLFKLKKCSGLKKKELRDRVLTVYENRAANVIQQKYTQWSLMKGVPANGEYTECPFTLEIPEWPFIVNDTGGRLVYYNLEPLVKYLGTPESIDSHGNPRCPVTRIPLSKKTMNSVEYLARKFKLTIPQIKNLSTREIESKRLRYILDSLIGEITQLINNYDTGILNFRTLMRNINGELIPTIVRNYNHLNRINSPEANAFVNDSINTLSQEYDNDIKEHFDHLFATLASRAMNN